MPGILPRVQNLFTSGFGYIAFLMAQIYAMVRLLPPNHAYLNPNNIGKFGIRQVVAQAANHLILKKENIDQLIIFAMILIGLVLIVIQIAMIVFTLVFEPALASYPTAPHPTGTSIFVTPGPASATGAPTFDIAFMLLDQVFGIPDMFESCIEQGVACGGTVSPTPVAFPWPFHNALHELFRFYNTGILVVGALIFLYFILIVVGETAVTGTPFGQRFQNVWVPIRLVVAIGLLIPLNYGYNSGQYITLFAAKIGSSFATNGWITYNNTIRLGGVFPGGSGANPTGERESLIGNPKTPDVSSLVQAMSLIHTCAAGYWAADNSDTKPYPPAYHRIQAYFYKNAQDWMANTENIRRVTAGTTYAQALDFYNDGDITIRFGFNGDDTNVPRDGVNTSPPGNGNNLLDSGETEVPKCGEMKIKIHSVGGSGVGPEEVQEYYFDLIRDMWFTPGTYELDAFAWRYAALKMYGGPQPAPALWACRSPGSVPTSAVGILDTDDTVCEDQPSSSWQIRQVTQLQSVAVEPALNGIWTSYTAAANEYEMTSEILRRGWAGAGIWYNTISRTNGHYMDAVRDIPTMTKRPVVMNIVAEASERNDANPTDSNVYCPETPLINLQGDQLDIAEALCNVHKYWNDAGQNLLDDDTIITGSAFEDTINLIFGTEPLSAMTAENVTTHPLTQLAMLGKGLVDASIRNVATASATSALGGIGAVFDRVIPGLVNPASEFILSTAFVGLTAGLVLYYIVPFLPFIYFFFAVASWVKSIFEAMVGVPLWALAHLRIDGDGLPGTSALNGYFLIFEIFLRPILTVFGLVAATLIFTAQVRVLHFLWDLVTQNLSGYDEDPTITFAAGNAGKGRLAFQRSIIDQFFFNVIYAIIVYMMAIAAFKLIDKIPDNLLRWMGNQVSSFGDINQDSVDGLTRYAALGGATAGRELASGVHGLAGQSGGTMGRLLSRVTGGGG